VKERGAALNKTSAPLNKRSQVCDILQKGNRFDIVIEGLLVSLLAFMPLAFGVVHAWSEEVVIVLSGAIVICFLLKLVYNHDRSIIWTWAYVPIGLFLLIPLLQLIPLPVTLVKIISPNTAVLKTELLSNLFNSDKLLKSMPLSFYPNATKHDLRLVLAVAAVFIVVLNVFRRPEQIKRLLMSITLIGGTIALITLGQNLFGNGKIYWFIPTRHGGGNSGPFVNHSNYGQFMNLSIGAGFGLLLVTLHESFAGKKMTPAVISEYFSSGLAKPLWLLITVISLCVATVFFSLTRGGMVSMLIAITFTISVLAWRRSLKGIDWIIVVIALIAFICVLYISFDAVYDRLASLRDFHEGEGSRLQIFKDIAVAWTHFPILGTGLGTHSVVYPMFDRSTITALAAYAENEYAQVLEETGLLGLILLVIFAIIVWSNYIRDTRPVPIKREPKVDGSNLSILSAAYGLGLGILAILIHSLSDFGQHLPANAYLSAIFCALLLVLARQKEDKQILNTDYRAGDFKIPRSIFLIRLSILLAVCGIWIWAFIGANNACLAETNWEKALDIEKGLVNRNWQGTDAEYTDLISYASTAVSHEPENIEYQHGLNVYRWHSISQNTDLNIGEIVISKDLMSSVRDIVDEFHKVCTLCPTYGPTYSIVGRIEKFVLDDNSGAESIRKGFRLAPCDPTACFIAGYLDVLEGKTEDCIVKFQRAVELDSGMFKDVVNIYINHLSRPRLAIFAAGNDIMWLRHVAKILKDMQYTDLSEQVQLKIENLLKARCLQPNTPAQELVYQASIYRKRQDNEAALQCYRRALALDYGRVDWRLDLAKILVEMGKIAEAMREAQICLQIRPQSKAAKKIVADLSIHPAIFDKEKSLH